MSTMGWTAINVRPRKGPESVVANENALEIASKDTEKMVSSGTFDTANQLSGEQQQHSIPAHPEITEQSKTPKSKNGPKNDVSGQEQKKKVYDRLGDAPHCDVPFPAPGKQANVTIVELVTFFPQYMKSIDVISRFISNGGTTGHLTRIANAHRELKDGGSSYANSWYKMMRNAMRNQGGEFAEWTTTSHATPLTHDSNSLDVSGFRTPREVKPRGKENQCAGPIQFKDLGNHIKKFPSGYDALDLTKAVKHAISFPDETWEWPKDFEMLIAVTGGPTPVREEHTDGAALQRWKHCDTTGKRTRSSAEQFDDIDIKSQPPKKRARHTSKSTTPQPLIFAGTDIGEDDDSEWLFCQNGS